MMDPFNEISEDNNRRGRKIVLVVAAVAAAIVLFFSASAMSHDPLIPVNDQWFQSLKVPSEGLALNKGGSCCNNRDCKERTFRTLVPGAMYQMQNDNGDWLTFGENVWITDPEVLANNPYFQMIGCISQGSAVCAVRGRTGG